MGCEGHFTVMQHYIREQRINNVLLPKSINMIQYCVNIFGEYIKFLKPENVLFGEKIMDFLIEVI